MKKVVSSLLSVGSAVARRYGMLLVVAALMLFSAVTGMAIPADATTVIADASTAFDTVSALIVTIVGFFIILRIVRRIGG